MKTKWVAGIVVALGLIVTVLTLSGGKGAMREAGETRQEILSEALDELRNN